MPQFFKEPTHLPKPFLYIIYVLILPIGLVAMYALLNAGSPDSLLRLIIHDPRYDIYIAAASSFSVFVLGFFIFFSRDREGFQHLLKLNSDKIREMRAQGKSDDLIADSMLSAMGSIRGYRHNMARKKLIVYLDDFK